VTAKPLRILQVPEFYSPCIGGMERHVQDLTQELSRRGHDVAVAVPTAGADHVSADGDVPVHHLRSWTAPLTGRLASDKERVFHPPLPDPGLIQRLQAVVDRFRPDVIHAHGWVLYTTLALRRPNGCKLVVTLHDHALVCANRAFVNRGRICDAPGLGKCAKCNSADFGVAKSVGLAAGLRLSAPLIRRFDGIVAVSSAVRDTSTRGLRGPNTIVRVIRGFIGDDVMSRAEGMRPSFLPPEDGYVLFVGALGRHKGLHVLLEAYQFGLGAGLVLVGTESDTSPRSYPEGVTVARDLGHADVMKAWSRCSVAVVPSVCNEAFGLVALEAMAAGRPVVASRVGGLVDIIQDGVTGILVPPGDALCLREAVLSLVGNQSKREEMGDAGRARAERFMMSEVVGEIESFYTDLLRVDRQGSRGGRDEFRWGSARPVEDMPA